MAACIDFLLRATGDARASHERAARRFHLGARSLLSRRDCINIVYIEGMDADGELNIDLPNEFNDLRLVLRVNKLDPRGAARIAFGQYKAWSVGTHMFGRPSAHEALVQTAPIRVYRDLNEDFERTGDQVFDGMFGVNQPCAGLIRAMARTTAIAS